MTALVVIAKECVPGLVKTRLHARFSPQQAARLAAASLADTLDTARATTADRRVLYFDGDPHAVDTDGFEVVQQPTGTLDERLAVIFDRLDEPTLLIGMDTPQCRPSQLRWPSSTDCVFGPAADGGYWALGMRAPRGDAVRGVPMSRADTGARQLAAIRGAGLTVERLDSLRDIDTPADAAAVAAVIPGSRFAAAFAAAIDGRQPVSR